MAKVRDIEDQSETDAGKVNERDTNRKAQLIFFKYKM